MGSPAPVGYHTWQTREGGDGLCVLPSPCALLPAEGAAGVQQEQAACAHQARLCTRSYPGAWADYSTVASYDRKYWFRVPTVWNKDLGCLTIRHRPEKVTPPGLPRSLLLSQPQTCGTSCSQQMQAKAAASLP